MSYFNSFPYKVNSVTIGREQRLSVVRDIMRRSKFISSVTDYSDIYNQYTIQDGDTPESIANEIYGSPNFFWVVMLFNEIHSQYAEWPMTDLNLQAFCRIIYPGTYTPAGSTEAVDNMFQTFYWRKDGVVVGEFKECYDISTWTPPVNSDITATAVSFYQHEFEINEAKRQIKLIRTEMLQDFVTQFEQGIGGA